MLISLYKCKCIVSRIQSSSIIRRIRSPGVGSVPVHSVSISHHLWAGLLTKYTHPQDHTHECDHFHLQHHYSTLGRVYSSGFSRLSFASVADGRQWSKCWDVRSSVSGVNVRTTVNNCGLRRRRETKITRSVFRVHSITRQISFGKHAHINQTYQKRASLQKRFSSTQHERGVTPRERFQEVAGGDRRQKSVQINTSASLSVILSRERWRSARVIC